MEKLLTVEEVAEIFRTTPSTVRYWEHVNKGPKSIKQGKKRLYPESAVRAHIEQLQSGDDAA